MMIDAYYQNRTQGDEFYTNFCGLNVPEDDVECKYFTLVSINSSVVYENINFKYIDFKL